MSQRGALVPVQENNAKGHSNRPRTPLVLAFFNGCPIERACGFTTGKSKSRKTRSRWLWYLYVPKTQIQVSPMTNDKRLNKSQRMSQAICQTSSIIIVKYEFAQFFVVLVVLGQQSKEGKKMDPSWVICFFFSLSAFLIFHVAPIHKECSSSNKCESKTEVADTLVRVFNCS